MARFQIQSFIHLIAQSQFIDRCEKERAIEHANKIEDDITRNFILEIIAQVYALPIEEINADVDAAREKVRAQFTEKCIATPHDKMPDYKPF